MRRTGPTDDLEADHTAGVLLHGAGEAPQRPNLVRVHRAHNVAHLQPRHVAEPAGDDVRHRQAPALLLHAESHLRPPRSCGAGPRGGAPLPRPPRPPWRTPGTCAHPATAPRACCAPRSQRRGPSPRTPPGCAPSCRPALRARTRQQRRPGSTCQRRLAHPCPRPACTWPSSDRASTWVSRRPVTGSAATCSWPASDRACWQARASPAAPAQGGWSTGSSSGSSSAQACRDPTQACVLRPAEDDGSRYRLARVRDQHWPARCPRSLAMHPATTRTGSLHAPRERPPQKKSRAGEHRVAPFLSPAPPRGMQRVPAVPRRPLPCPKDTPKGFRPAKRRPARARLRSTSNQIRAKGLITRRLCSFARHAGAARRAQPAARQRAGDQ